MAVQAQYCILWMVVFFAKGESAFIIINTKDTLFN